MASKETGAAARRILIVLMGSLGDVVRGLALVDAIREGWSDAHITWLVEPACEGIVRLHPRINEVITFQRKEGVRGIIRLARELRHRTFDYALDLQRHGKSGLFSRLSGAPVRIGFHPTDAKEGNWLWNNRYVEARGETISKIEQYQSFLDALDIPRPARLSFGLDAITFASLAPREGSATAPLRLSALEGQRFIVLVLGSSWDSKDWPEEGYIGLLQAIRGMGLASVALVGDRSKVALAEQLEQGYGEEVGAPQLVNLVGMTNLQELVAVLRHATVVVGPDSGPGHISGAVGTPYITLFGPTPVGRNAPYGSEGLALVSQVGCAPCKRRVCPGLGKVCMKLIHPHAVVERIGEVLSRQP